MLLRPHPLLSLGLLNGPFKKADPTHYAPSCTLKKRVYPLIAVSVPVHWGPEESPEAGARRSSEVPGMVPWSARTATLSAPEPSP